MLIEIREYRLGIEESVGFWQTKIYSKQRKKCKQRFEKKGMGHDNEQEA